MNRPNLERELVRAETSKDVSLIGRSIGLRDGAHDDAARRIVSALYMDSHGRLAAHSGERADEYIRARLTTMRDDPATAHLFGPVVGENSSARAPAAAVRGPTRPVHPESPRQKLDRANGVDPYAGF